MIFKNLCILLLRTNIDSALVGLTHLIHAGSLDAIIFQQLTTQVKVDGPVHARSKHARYMHNDAQQCNGPAQTGLLQAC